MYPGLQAKTRPDQPAIVMARSGETITYRELDERSNRLAHLLRDIGLKRGDHYAVFMENHPRYIECDAAGERSGLYFTNINSFLTAGELAYIVNNSLSKVLITSEAERATAIAAIAECPDVEFCLIVDGPSHGARVQNLDEATTRYPATPIPDEALGAAMLYSSGTTGRPKGVLRPLIDQPPAVPHPLIAAFAKFWRFREGQDYLSPAPLYHAAPLVGVAAQSAMAALYRHGAFRRGRVLVSGRRGAASLIRSSSHHVLAHPEAARERAPHATISLRSRSVDSRCRTVPCASEGGNDRVVGADHP